MNTGQAAGPTERPPGPLLGRGLTADVYAHQAGRALKLFHRWVRPDAAASELRITRAVRAAGAPAPEAFELVTVDGRQGIVFERVAGHSMVREVELRPWRLFALARQLADLHAALHRLQAPAELPTQRQQIARWIDGAHLEPAERAVYQSLLEAASDGVQLCHGDFHPGNVILSPGGPVVLDWSRATRGIPVLDLARTSVLITDAELPAETAWHVRALMGLGRQALHRSYLARYAKHTGLAPAHVTRWRQLQQVAALAWKAQARAHGPQPTSDTGG